MADPKLVFKRQATNQASIGLSTPKTPSHKSIKLFNSQNNILKNTLSHSSRDNLANTLSNKSASNDGSYPKCNSTSVTPCIITAGYEDSRAYPGSGMAGWPQAGLAGNTDKQISAGVGVTADLFLFGIGASSELAWRSHGNTTCADLSACIQLGLGLHAGVGGIMNIGIENNKQSKSSLSAGGFVNVFATGGSVNLSDSSVSSGKGVFGFGAGANGGVQVCASVSLICNKNN